MQARWTLFALLFSVAVNIAVVGTLVFFWGRNERRMDVEVLHREPPPMHDILWFDTPHVPPHVAQEIDSLRREYHQQLVLVRTSIDSDRKAIVTQLMSDHVNRDSLDIFIKTLSDKQIQAERLTIDHLLMIKPLLPKKEWQFFINELQPRRTIQTKIIKLKDGDSTSILFNDEEIDEFKLFEQESAEKNQIYKFKHKN